MSFKTIKLAGEIVLGLSLSFLAASKADAANFSFTKLVTDKSQDYLLYKNTSHLSINDLGKIAYSENAGRFVTATDGITRNDWEVTPGNYIFTPSINNKGTVVSLGTLIKPDNSITVGAFLLNGNQKTFIPKVLAGGSDTVYGDLAINDSNTLAFPSTGSEFSLPFFPPNNFNLSIKPDDGYTSVVEINNAGIVAFTGRSASGKQGIVIGKGNSSTVIADTDGIFDRFFQLIPDDGFADRFITPSLAINDTNTVTFRATLDTGVEGIFTGDGTTTKTIADSTGAFSFFKATSINNRGTVVFSAGLDDGGFGIFTASNSIADKVIATGDPLFGSMVTGLDFYQQGLNNLDELAFKATLADGRTVFVRSNAVPEPLSIIGTIALGFFGAKYRQRQTQVRC
jgi:hypothetical protein